MTTADVSKFPALEEATQILGPLDGHRQRQVMAFVFERYGWNLQPAAKKIAPAPTSPTNRSEFVAVEQLADLLDGVVYSCRFLPAARRDELRRLEIVHPPKQRNA